MELINILSVNQEIQESKTFGGLYKITKYSQPVIQLITSLNLEPITLLVNENSNATIDDVEDTQLKQQLFNIQQLLQSDDLAYEQELLPDNYLTRYYEATLINNLYEIDFKSIELSNLPKLVVGQMYNLYSFSDKTFLGKGMLRSLDVDKRKGTLKIFKEILEPKVYVQIDKWWQYSSNSTDWLEDSVSALIAREGGRATMKVNYETTIQRLGRINWTLAYKSSQNNEYKAIAQGVDSLLPGLLIISKKDYLFAGGYYKLSIIDKSLSLTLSTKKYLEWYKDYSCSELLSEGTELRNG